MQGLQGSLSCVAVPSSSRFNPGAPHFRRFDAAAANDDHFASVAAPTGAAKGHQFFRTSSRSSLRFPPSLAGDGAESLKARAVSKCSSCHRVPYHMGLGRAAAPCCRAVIMVPQGPVSLNVPAPRSPDMIQFLEGAQKGNLVPVFQRIFSDQLTPVLAYRCLVKEDERDIPSFIFESIEHGEFKSNVGQFSMVGARPAMEIIAKENSLTIINHEEGSREEKIVDDPMSEPEKIISQWKPVIVDGLPQVFCGGWVGYFSYDTMRYVEKNKLPFSDAPEDDRGLPDIHLGLYKDVLVFDHITKVVYVVHWIQLDQFESPAAAYQDGQYQLQLLVDRLQNSERPRLQVGTMDLHTGQEWEAETQVSNMTKEEYQAKVLEAKEHIMAGDVFQVVLSQRFQRRTVADPFDVFRALRVVSPSPYMIYMQARGSIMVGASPEILSRIEKGKVINRPLAGTRRRGKTPQEDKNLEEGLRKDVKEVAEHTMLVDLARNDVGKVSKASSVVVEKLMDVERFSHVMHLSSTVTGDLLDDMTSWDALRSALPVGTVSGAPKVRAMQIIDELEPSRRGPYSGGIGSISFTGDMDIALALRTMVFPTFDLLNTVYNCPPLLRNDNLNHFNYTSQREWLVHLQAGAGIVADSDPASEYQECINKATALSKAIDLAEATFVQPKPQLNTGDLVIK